MTKVTTNFESRSVASGGTWKIADGAECTTLKILTIIPKADCTVTTLVGDIPGNDAYDFKAERGLDTLEAGLPYFAGDNSCFTDIQVSGSILVCYL